MKTSMLANLGFADDSVLSYFFFFFFIFDLYFLIPAVIAQIFNPFAERLIPLGIRTKEVKAKMETHPVIVRWAVVLEFLEFLELIWNCKWFLKDP